jgi:prepilin-type N-terminal cleavage/methylation domain-containing protein
MISFKNLKTRLSQDRSGFTIVELLIVIVVIAILAVLVIVTYS